jgi:sulfite exporter TauE/SafE/copper chaperone CopZ
MADAYRPHEAHAHHGDGNGEVLRILHLHIAGMHCANCPVVVERKLKALPQVQSVEVKYPTGRARVEHAGELDIATLQTTLEEDGYTVSAWEERALSGIDAGKNTLRDYLEIGAAFVILWAIIVLLQQFDLLPRGLSVSEHMSYGLVFVIGLVASISSCIAVTGGLLVAVAAKYNEVNAHLPNIEKLKPHIYFNAGRIVSYTLLGGAVGALGSALMLSPEVNGILTIVASVVMIVLGLQMLRLFPSFGRLMPTMPKVFAHAIHDFAERETKGAAFLLGASTFFLPCGFTQALQLYVLAKGSFSTGALTMLAFALGTLPALLSLSAISSLAKGAFQTHFLKLAGVAVIILGFLNIQYGLVLGGMGISEATTAAGLSKTTQAKNGEAPKGEPQRISMRVLGLDYHPNRFTVRQGVPVQWWIDASDAAACGRFLMAPGLGIRKLLSDTSSTLISFTPLQAGEFTFNCGMGMMTPGSKITVLPKDKG